MNENKYNGIIFWKNPNKKISKVDKYKKNLGTHQKNGNIPNFKKIPIKNNLFKKKKNLLTIINKEPKNLIKK